MGANSGALVFLGAAGGLVPPLANNALEVNAGVIQMGGPYVKDTEIEMAGFELLFSGPTTDVLRIGKNADNTISFLNGSWILDPTAFALSAGDIVQFDANGLAAATEVTNGLSITTGPEQLKLGGTLIELTDIDFNNAYAIGFVEMGFNFGSLSLWENARNTSATRSFFRPNKWIQNADDDEVHELWKEKYSLGTWYQGASVLSTLGPSANSLASGIVFDIKRNAQNYTQFFTVNLGNSTTQLTQQEAFKINQFRDFIFYQTIPNSADYAGTPHTVPADSWLIYAADANGAGTNAPHFKTENAETIILYPFNDYGAPTGTLTRTTFDSGTINLPGLAERVAALITDLQQNNLIGTI